MNSKYLSAYIYRNKDIYNYIYIYVCTDACTYDYICIPVNLCKRVFVSMYLYKYKCMYVNINRYVIKYLLYINTPKHLTAHVSKTSPPASSFTPEIPKGSKLKSPRNLHA